MADEVMQHSPTLDITTGPHVMDRTNKLSFNRCGRQFASVGSMDPKLPSPTLRRINWQRHIVIWQANKRAGTAEP